MADDAKPVTPAEAVAAGLAQVEAVVAQESSRLSNEELADILPVAGSTAAAVEGDSEAEISVSVHGSLSGSELATVRLRVSGGIEPLYEAVREAVPGDEHFRLVHGRRILRVEETVADLGLADGTVLLACYYTPSVLLTASADGLARIFDSETGACLRTLEGHEGSILSVQFSPDGKKALTTSVDRTARLFDLANGSCERTFGGHSASVNTAAFSADGHSILTGCYDGTVCLFDVQTGQRTRKFDRSETIARSMVFVPGNQKPPLALVAAGGQLVKLLDLESGIWKSSLAGHAQVVRTARLSPDGKKLITASDDCTARLWNIATGKCEGTFEGHSRAVCTASFSPDGLSAVTASDDGTAKVFATVAPQLPQGLSVERDVATERAAEELFGGLEMRGSLLREASPAAGASPRSPTTPLSPSWPASIANSAAQAPAVQLSGRALITLHSGGEPLYHASFSPNGGEVVTASVDASARVFDASSGECKHTLRGHRLPVRMAVFSPDGKKVLTASHDRTAKLFDVKLGVCEQTFEGHKQAVFFAAFLPEVAALATVTSRSM